MDDKAEGFSLILPRLAELNAMKPYGPNQMGRLVLTGLFSFFQEAFGRSPYFTTPVCCRQGTGKILTRKHSCQVATHEHGAGEVKTVRPENMKIVGNCNRIGRSPPKTPWKRNVDANRPKAL